MTDTGGLTHSTQRPDPVKDPAVSPRPIVQPASSSTATGETRSLIDTGRPRNVVTYFGGYASAMHDEFVHVHVLRDGDNETFCGLTAGLRFGTPREVGRAHKMCEACLNEAQAARRDV